MSDMSELEISIDQAKQTIALKNSLDRLSVDPNFIRVIINGYFKDEASRLVLLKADPSMTGKDDQEIINKSIDAIGYFRLYLRTVIQRGLMAEKALVDDEETRQAMMQETEE